MSDKTANSTKAKVEGKTLVIERVFDAPRELVFKDFFRVRAIGKLVGAGRMADCQQQV